MVYLGTSAQEKPHNIQRPAVVTCIQQNGHSIFISKVNLSARVKQYQHALLAVAIVWMSCQVKRKESNSTSFLSLLKGIDIRSFLNGRTKALNITSTCSLSQATRSCFVFLFRSSFLHLGKKVVKPSCFSKGCHTSLSSSKYFRNVLFGPKAVFLIFFLLLVIVIITFTASHV